MKPIASIARFGFALLFATACCVASAQVTKQGSGYLLRMKFKQGEVTKFVMTTTTSGSGAPAMNLKMPMTTKVLAVKGGVAEVEYNVGPMTNNGKAMGEAQKVTSKIDSRGKLSGGSPQLQQMGNITLPEKAIPVGGVWKGTQNSQAGPSGSITINATYTLVGIKTVGGKQVAEIKVAMTGGNQMLKTTGGGTMFLRVADGSLHSTVLDQSISIAQGQQSITVKSKVSIVRQ